MDEKGRKDMLDLDRRVWGHRCMKLIHRTDDEVKADAMNMPGHIYMDPNDCSAAT